PGAAAIRLRMLLETEFAKRRSKNPRYSLRAFAQSVAMEHSTLSQLLRGKRPVTWKSVHKLAGNLRWSGKSVSDAFVQQGRFNSQAIANQLGISVDEVNIALTDLCIFRLIELKGE